MRPWEATVVIAAIAWVVTDLTRLRHHGLWLRLLIPTSVACCVAQLVLEGHRFHLVPAQLAVATGAVLAGRRIQNPIQLQSRFRLRPRPVVVIWLAVLAAGIALPLLFPVFIYPPPSGPLAIGTVVATVRDTTRLETLSPAPGDFRETPIQIWYPATPVEGARFEPAFPRASLLQHVMGLTTGLPPFMLDNLRYVRGRAVRDAPVADASPTYPVILFSHEFATSRSMNLSQVHDLVSHGYIVVGIDHTYFAGVAAFPDGHAISYRSAVGFPSVVSDLSRRIVDTWAADARRVLTELERMNADPAGGQLRGRMDLTHVGYLGTGIGGGSVTRALFLDPRFSAGIAEDGSPWEHEEVVRAGIRQPFLYMESDEPFPRASQQELEARGVTPELWSALGDYQPMRVKRFFGSLKGPAYALHIRGMTHRSFGDALLFMPSRSAGSLRIDRAHRIVNDYTRAFFDRYLRGVDSPLLRESTASHDNPVTLLRRNG